MGVASVCEELDVERSKGEGGVIGFKGGFEKLAGLGSECKNSSGVSIAGCFKVELVS